MDRSRRRTLSRGPAQCRTAWSGRAAPRVAAPSPDSTGSPAGFPGRIAGIASGLAFGFKSDLARSLFGRFDRLAFLAGGGFGPVSLFTLKTFHALCFLGLRATCLAFGD